MGWWLVGPPKSLRLSTQVVDLEHRRDFDVVKAWNPYHDDTILGFGETLTPDGTRNLDGLRQSLTARRTSFDRKIHRRG